MEYFKSEDKLIEAQRIAERTNFDLEMLRETASVQALKITQGIWRIGARGYTAYVNRIFWR